MLMNYHYIWVVGTFGAWLELRKNKILTHDMKRKQAVKCITKVGADLIMDDHFGSAYHISLPGPAEFDYRETPMRDFELQNLLTFHEQGSVSFGNNSMRSGNKES